MMSMMEGIEEYATPPHIRSPSPSTQLVTGDVGYDGEHNHYPFFASSASHTLFPAITLDQEDDHNNHNHNHEEHHDEDENDQDDVQFISSVLQPNNQSHIQPSSSSSQSHQPLQQNQLQQELRDISDEDLEELILNPWTDSSHKTFHHKFSPANPSYKNKLRLNPHAESRVRHFVMNPTSGLDPRYPSDARLKNRSKAYTLHPRTPTGQLYRSDTATGIVRRHVGSGEVWDMLTNEHVRSGHKGRDKMLSLIKEKFIGYTLEEVMFVLYECRVCQRAKLGIGTVGGKDAIGVELAQRVKAAAKQGDGAAREGETPAGLVDIAPAVGTGRNMVEYTTGVADTDGQRTGGIASVVGATYPASLIDPAIARLSPHQQGLQQVQRADGKRVATTQGGTDRRQNRFTPNHMGLVEYDYPDWFN